LVTEAVNNIGLRPKVNTCEENNNQALGKYFEQSRREPG
jgi:hypothetical protein